MILCAPVYISLFLPSFSRALNRNTNRNRIVTWEKIVKECFETSIGDKASRDSLAFSHFESCCFSISFVVTS